LIYWLLWCFITILIDVFATLKVAQNEKDPETLRLDGIGQSTIPLEQFQIARSVVEYCWEMSIDHALRKVCDYFVIFPYSLSRSHIHSIGILHVYV